MRCCRLLGYLLLSISLFAVCRPKAVRLVSGVGSEEVEFEPAIPMEGKVEIYMQVSNFYYPAGSVPMYLRLSRYGSHFRSVVRMSWFRWYDEGPLYSPYFGPLQ